jgi:hypothetical protein
MQTPFRRRGYKIFSRQCEFLLGQILNQTLAACPAAYPEHLGQLDSSRRRSLRLQGIAGINPGTDFSCLRQVAQKGECERSAPGALSPDDFRDCANWQATVENLVQGTNASAQDRTNLAWRDPERRWYAVSEGSFDLCSDCGGRRHWYSPYIRPRGAVMQVEVAAKEVQYVSK